MALIKLPLEQRKLIVEFEEGSVEIFRSSGGAFSFSHQGGPPIPSHWKGKYLLGEGEEEDYFVLRFSPPVKDFYSEVTYLTPGDRVPRVAGWVRDKGYPLIADMGHWLAEYSAPEFIFFRLAPIQWPGREPIIFHEVHMHGNFDLNSKASKKNDAIWSNIYFEFA